MVPRASTIVLVIIISFVAMMQFSHIAVEYFAPSKSSHARDQVVHLFFTGGVASTYHLCHRLLVDGRRVRPVYISANIDDTDPRRCRLSIVEELRSIKRVIELIRRKFPAASERLMPPQYESYMIIDKDVLAARKRLFNGSSGGQYAGTCQWVRNQSTLGSSNIEMAVLFGSRTQKLHALIKENCKKVQDRYVVRSNRRRTDFGLLFGRVDFSLVDMDAGRMQSVARRHGFQSIMTRAWTCWVPNRQSGEACGRCAGCADRHRFIQIGRDLRSRTTRSG